jgi:predicted HTH transcriptional regulator
MCWVDHVATCDPKYPDLNVFSFYDKVLEKLRAGINQHFSLDNDLRRRQVFTDMEIALRESLANMLIHADYYQDMPLTAIVYHNYYEFSNPGRLKVPIETYSLNIKLSSFFV